MEVLGEWPRGRRSPSDWDGRREKKHLTDKLDKTSDRRGPTSFFAAGFLFHREIDRLDAKSIAIVVRFIDRDRRSFFFERSRSFAVDSAFVGARADRASEAIGSSRTHSSSRYDVRDVRHHRVAPRRGAARRARAPRAPRAPRRRATHARARVAAAGKPTLVKVCGVTSVADCALAVAQGADFVGMILWPKSKRSVDLALAREIADAAKAGGAIPVGVFVDESVDAITSACAATGIDHAQLHGDGARGALKDLPMAIKAIWVVSADKDGTIVTPLPGDEDALMKQRSDAMGANPVTAAVDWVKARAARWTGAWWTASSPARARRMNGQT